MIWIAVFAVVMIVAYFFVLSSQNENKAMPPLPSNDKSEDKQVAAPKQPTPLPLTPIKPVVESPASEPSSANLQWSANTNETINSPEAAGTSSGAALNLITAFLANSIDKYNSEPDNLGPHTFQRRIGEFEDQVIRLASMLTYLGISDYSSSNHQFASSQYSFAVIGSFIPDAHDFKDQVKHANQIPDLEAIKDNIIQVNHLVYNLHDALKPSENVLKASKLLTDIQDDAMKEANDKISQINTASFGVKISPASEQLFNLGFYLSNSRHLFTLPDQSVTEGFFDFKTEFFPTFETIKWQDYLVADRLFDLALQADPANILAKIYKQTVRLEAAMWNEDANYDRNEIIRCLEEILAKYSRHALAHIELAGAYASISRYGRAQEHVEQALNISPDSSYVQYKAMIMYRNQYEAEKADRLLSSLDNEDNNPRIYYAKALAMVQKGLKWPSNLKAFFAINSAVEHGKSKDFFGLRNEILVTLKRQLSAADYESMRGEELTSEGELGIKLLDQREERFKMWDNVFSQLVSLTFSPDYASVEILTEHLPPIQLPLSDKKASVIFLDFNLTLDELASLDAFACPSILTSGDFYVEDTHTPSFGTLYLKNLNIESLVRMNP